MRAWLNGDAEIDILPANAASARVFFGAPWRHHWDGRPAGLDWQQCLAVCTWLDIRPEPRLYTDLMMMEQAALEHCHA